MKENKFLPLGSVVLLKNATKRLMITGYIAIVKNENKIFDYCGCIYPEGYISSDSMFLFNHNDIDKIIFLGLKDDEYENFTPMLNDVYEKMNYDSGNDFDEIK